MPDPEAVTSRLTLSTHPNAPKYLRPHSNLPSTVGGEAATRLRLLQNQCDGSGIDLRNESLPSIPTPVNSGFHKRGNSTRTVTVENPFPRFGKHADPALVKKVELLERFLPVSASASIMGLMGVAVAERGVPYLQKAIGYDLSSITGPLEAVGVVVFAIGSVVMLATMSASDRIEQRITDTSRDNRR